MKTFVSIYDDTFDYEKKFSVTFDDFFGRVYNKDNYKTFLFILYI